MPKQARQRPSRNLKAQALVSLLWRAHQHGGQAGDRYGEPKGPVVSGQRFPCLCAYPQRRHKAHCQRKLHAHNRTLQPSSPALAVAAPGNPAQSA